MKSTIIKCSAGLALLATSALAYAASNDCCASIACCLKMLSCC